MAGYKNIQEIQEALKNLLTTQDNDPGGFANKIDQFNYDEIANSLSDYWNSSVTELYNTLMNIVPADNWNNTFGQGHDAGHGFMSSPYVSPNVNELGEDYLTARDDEIESVLKNQNNLDYTIGDYITLTDELKKYMTRLLMPQYERRVEVEDLNRNFWVIGQNLTALNKLVLDLGDDFIKKLIGELTGLWDNIYRIWQALFYLNDKIYSISDNEKVRFMMEYGFNQPSGNTSAVEAVTFNKENAYQYGILPYVCKKQLINNKNEVCYAYYMPYNRRLDNQLIENKSQEELLTNFNVAATGLGLIKMDCKHTNRNIEKMLKTIRERNFVLFAKSKEDLLPYLRRTQNPLLTALDFYRDYLYYVQNADNSNPLSTLIKDTSIWKQSGYLQYIDFITTTNINSFIDTARIDDNVIGAFGYIKSLFKDSLNLGFVNSVAQLKLGSTISDLKNIVASTNITMDILITDLYNLFIECQKLVGMDIKDYSSNDGTEQNPQYTIKTQEDIFVNDFIAALKEYEKQNSLDGNGTYQSISEKMDLPYINWDLLSMTNERIEDIDSDFGQSYLFKYNTESKEDHLWIDFVADINRDSYIENGRSTIGSYTENDLRNAIDKDDLLYDFNITVPLNKDVSSNSDIPKYIDFVRLGRPYPNVFLVTDNVSKSNDLNDIQHLKSLNIIDNWIGYQNVNNTNNYYYCIDGFYPFSNNGYLNINEIDNLVSNNIYEKYQLENILTYNIASSDLIDCEHTNDSSGQTRINNKYNFENPVINLRFINGRTDSQEIEIVITKDVTDKDMRREVEKQYLTFATVKIGDIYPNIVNASTKFTKITEPEGPGYTIGTYGIGSYHGPHYNDDTLNNLESPIKCKFVPYTTISQGGFETLSYEELTQDVLTQMGKEYIEILYRNNEIPKETLIVTKIGLTYWNGDDGSQWSNGMVVDLFQVKPTANLDIPEITFLAHIKKKDGYWDDAKEGELGVKGTVFKRSEIGHTKWRHLDLRVPKDSIEIDNEGNILNQLEGALTWYDKNRRGSAEEVENTVNQEVKTRGRWVKGSDNKQERVVGYCNFVIKDNNLNINMPEYYRLINEKEFTSLNGEQSVLFQDYNIPQNWYEFRNYTFI